MWYTPRETLIISTNSNVKDNTQNNMCAPHWVQLKMKEKNTQSKIDLFQAITHIKVNIVARGVN